MRRRLLIDLALFGGTAAMTLAVTCSTVTLTSGDYRSALLTALAAVVAADACLTYVLVRGRLWWRVAAVIVMVPTLLVIADFVRRAPHVF